MAPGSGEWAAFGEIIGQEWIEESEPWGEDPAVGLGEEDGYASSGRGSVGSGVTPTAE